MADPSVPYRLDYDEREEIADKAQSINKRFRGEKIAGLCGTCRYAHIFRQTNQNDYKIRCGELGEFVAPNIAECNRYVNESKLTVMELARLARVIDNKNDEKTGHYF